MITEYENGQSNRLGGDGESASVELLPTRSSFVEAQVRGEVDLQISTARAYPRSIKAFRQKALSLATLDEDTAASCFYSLPRGGKPIEGMSVRLAEIVAVSWGNLRAQANVVDVDDKWITARGICWDLESNYSAAVEVRRRITDKHGRRYNDDMIGVTSNAACSIALRNAVFKVVPLAMAKPIYEQARKVAIGDAQTLSSRRAKMVEHFGKMGVLPEQIFAKVERASIDDITLDDLGTLIGLATAIKDGDTTVDEAFRVEQPKTDAKPPASKSEAIAEKLKRPNGAAKTVEPEPQHTIDELTPVEADESLMIREGEKGPDYVGRVNKAILECQSLDGLDAIMGAAQACYEHCGEAGWKSIDKKHTGRREQLLKAQEGGSLLG